MIGSPYYDYVLQANVGSAYVFVRSGSTWTEQARLTASDGVRTSNTATKTICGATTSLSPFAVLGSRVVRTGFHAPVNPVAGFLNTVKGGSTVPLKFNVFVDGSEQTTTSGLELTLQQIPCDPDAPQDPVEVTPDSGGNGLHYAGGSFIYNWKTPKTPGLCYMIRMTTAQDGLALTGRFKMK